jgi:hypothetical protein
LYELETHTTLRRGTFARQQGDEIWRPAANHTDGQHSLYPLSTDTINYYPAIFSFCSTSTVNRKLPTGAPYALHREQTSLSGTMEHIGIEIIWMYYFLVPLNDI